MTQPRQKPATASRVARTITVATRICPTKCIPKPVQKMLAVANIIKPRRAANRLGVDDTTSPCSLFGTICLPIVAKGLNFGPKKALIAKSTVNNQTIGSKPVNTASAESTTT